MISEFLLKVTFDCVNSIIEPYRMALVFLTYKIAVPYPSHRLPKPWPQAPFLVTYLINCDIQGGFKIMSLHVMYILIKLPILFPLFLQVLEDGRLVNKNGSSEPVLTVSLFGRWYTKDAHSISGGTSNSATMYLMIPTLLMIITLQYTVMVQNITLSQSLIHLRFTKKY